MATVLVITTRRAAAHSAAVNMQAPRGRLRIGAFPTADASLVPRAIATFQHAHPKVALSLVERLTPGQLAQLHSGDIDLAVVSTAPSWPLNTAGLELHHLLDDTMFVALPSAHPLVGRGVLRLAQLAEERWVAGRGRVDDTLVTASTRVGFRPRIELMAAEWIAKQGLVAAGLGISLVPSLALDATRPDIALAPLHRDDVPATRTSACCVTPAMSRSSSPRPHREQLVILNHD